MKYLAAIWLTVATLVIGFVLFSTKHESTPVESAQTLPASANTQVTSAVNEQPEAVKATPSPASNAFDDRFHDEAGRVGQLDDSPEKTEQRLRDFARSLRVPELQSLARKASDFKVNGDERFLAVQLIAWNGSSEAVPLLEKIATESIRSGLDERVQSFEVALRALAIESITGVGTVEERIMALNRVSSNVDHKFLSDRTQRSLAYLKTPDEVPSPEEQDRQALTEVIEH
jgi:hypothetical protein